MKKRTKRSMREVLENKVVSVIIGFSVVAIANTLGLISVSITVNLTITVIITVLTLIASFFVRKHQYNRFMKEVGITKEDSYIVDITDSIPENFTLPPDILEMMNAMEDGGVVPTPKEEYIPLSPKETWAKYIADNPEIKVVNLEEVKDDDDKRSE